MLGLTVGGAMRDGVSEGGASDCGCTGSAEGGVECNPPRVREVGEGLCDACRAFCYMDAAQCGRASCSLWSVVVLLQRLRLRVDLDGYIFI